MQNVLESVNYNTLNFIVLSVRNMRADGGEIIELPENKGISEDKNVLAVGDVQQIIDHLSNFE